MSGFRYVLEPPDGESVEPMVFVTEVDRWQVGDSFVPSFDLQRFRILAIDSEPLGRARGAR